MASEHEEFLVEASPERVWAAVRDVAAADRLFPGVLIDSQATADGRVVTFVGGGRVREVVVDLDDVRRRLAYTAVEGPLGASHHAATMEIHPGDAGGSRVVWVTDVLPHHLADPVAALMRRGAAAMQSVLTG